MLPVTIGDEASIDRALALEKGDALFDVRHRFVVSFGAELPTPEHMGAIVAARARRLAAERHRPGADRLPDRRSYDPTTDIRYLTNRPDSDLRSERRRAAHRRSVVQHRLLRAPARCRDTGTSRATPAATPCAGPGFARTDLSLFKNIDLRAQPPHPAARRGVQPVQPDPLRPARQPDRHGRTSAGSRAPKTGGSFSSRRSTVSTSRRAAAAHRLREADLLKPPGVAESLDWARALQLVGARHLDIDSAAATLGAVLKYREDADRVRARLDTLLAS